MRRLLRTAGAVAGDCDNDKDCGTGLICWDRPKSKAVHFPSLCKGTDKLLQGTDQNDLDVCVDEAEAKKLVKAGFKNTGNP